MFLRILRHLLPTGRAWRLVVDRMLKRYLGGLLTGFADPAKEALDDVADDARPALTRALPEWEDQFGGWVEGDEAARRNQVAVEFLMQGGQSTHYIETILHAAGFTNLYVHQWWEPNTFPRVARDPRDYGNQPLIGQWQCGDPEAQCGNPNVLCDAFQANLPSYLVNRNLTPNAPPPIPDDPARWPYFIYIGGETFPEIAEVPAERRAELERLLLKICPMHLWIVLITDTTVYLTDIDSAFLLDVDDAFLTA